MIIYNDHWTWTNKSNHEYVFWNGNDLTYLDKCKAIKFYLFSMSMYLSFVVLFIYLFWMFLHFFQTKQRRFGHLVNRQIFAGNLWNLNDPLKIQHEKQSKHTPVTSPLIHDSIFSELSLFLSTPPKPFLANDHPVYLYCTCTFPLDSRTLSRTPRPRIAHVEGETSSAGVVGKKYDHRAT